MFKRVRISKLITYTPNLTSIYNCIGGIMVSMLSSSAVSRGFEPRSGQTKDYKIGICCFSAKHAALRRKSKDWLARNQDNVSEWDDMSTRDCCFTNSVSWHYKYPTQCVGLVQSGPHHHHLESVYIVYITWSWIRLVECLTKYLQLCWSHDLFIQEVQ